MAEPLSRRQLLGAAAKSAVALALGAAFPAVVRARTKTTITYMVNAGYDASAVAQEMIPKHFTPETGIEVNIVSIAFADVFPKTVLAAKSESGAYDLVQMNRNTLPALVQPNLLVPIDNYVNPETLKDLFPVHRKFVTFGGKMYAYPYSSDLRCLYYRSDVLGRHGLSVPTNWGEQLHAARTVNHPPEMYGMLLAGSNAGPGVWVLADFIHQAGGSILDAKNQPSVDTAAAIEGLTYFVDLYRKYKVLPPGTPTYQWTNTRTIFPQGTAAMVQEFEDIYPLLNAPDSKIIGKYGLAPIPGLRRAGTNQGGWLLGIPKGAKHPKEAGQLMDFVLSKKVQLAMSQKTGALSARQSVFHDLIVEGKPNLPRWNPLGKSRWEFYREITATSYALPRVAQEPAIENVLGEALSACFAGLETPKSAMKKAQGQIAALLKG